MRDLNCYFQKHFSKKPWIQVSGWLSTWWTLSRLVEWCLLYDWATQTNEVYIIKTAYPPITFHRPLPWRCYFFGGILSKVVVASLWLCLKLCAKPWALDKQAMAVSKDVLSCMQLLCFRDKPLLCLSRTSDSGPPNKHDKRLCISFSIE